MQRKELPKNSKREKTVEINILAVVCLALTVLTGVLLLFVSLHFVKKFVPVRSFEIVGESVYTPEEIAARVGIETGEKLYRFNASKVEEAILKKCPYVESVKFKRTIFGKAKFVIDSYEPLWYIEISGDFYVLDSDLRVLEETRERERLYESNLIFLTLPHVKTAIVGEILSFGVGEAEISETKEIMQTICSSLVFDMICSADIDNRYDIHFEFDKIAKGNNESDATYEEIDGIFTVNVGGYSKLRTKLEYIFRAILAEELSDAAGGTIDVSDVGNKVSIRPVYSQE